MAVGWYGSASIGCGVNHVCRQVAAVRFTALRECVSVISFSPQRMILLHIKLNRADRWMTKLSRLLSPSDATLKSRLEWHLRGLMLRCWVCSVGEGGCWQTLRRLARVSYGFVTGQTVSESVHGRRVARVNFSWLRCQSCLSTSCCCAFYGFA